MVKKSLRCRTEAQARAVQAPELPPQAARRLRPCARARPAAPTRIASGSVLLARRPPHPLRLLPPRRPPPQHVLRRAWSQTDTSQVGAFGCAMLSGALQPALHRRKILSILLGSGSLRDAPNRLHMPYFAKVLLITASSAPWYCAHSTAHGTQVHTDTEVRTKAGGCLCSVVCIDYHQLCALTLQDKPR